MRSVFRRSGWRSGCRSRRPARVLRTVSRAWMMRGVRPPGRRCQYSSQLRTRWPYGWASFLPRVELPARSLMVCWSAVSRAVVGDVVDRGSGGPPGEELRDHHVSLRGASWARAAATARPAFSTAALVGARSRFRRRPGCPSSCSPPSASSTAVTGRTPAATSTTSCPG